MRIKLIFLLCLAFLIGGCGSNSKNDEDFKISKGKRRSVAERIQSRDMGSQQSVTDETEDLTLKFFPEVPTVKSDLQIIVQGLPEDAEEELEYLWLKNKKNIAEAKSGILSTTFFKKNDWIQCWVRRKGEQFWLKSPIIQIANCPPEIQPAQIENIRLPGTISYQIKATDPDGDQLNYYLNTKLPGEVQFDEKSGLLIWKVAEDDIASIESPFNVDFTVSDGSGGETKFSLQFNFAEQEVEKKE